MSREFGLRVRTGGRFFRCCGKDLFVPFFLLILIQQINHRLRIVEEM